jgi:hypothetical protein
MTLQTGLKRIWGTHPMATKTLSRSLSRQSCKSCNPVQNDPSDRIEKDLGNPSDGNQKPFPSILSDPATLKGKQKAER